MAPEGGSSQQDMERWKVDLQTHLTEAVRNEFVYLRRETMQELRSCIQDLQPGPSVAHGAVRAKQMQKPDLITAPPRLPEEPDDEPFLAAGKAPRYPAPEGGFASPVQSLNKFKMQHSCTTTDSEDDGRMSFSNSLLNRGPMRLSSQQHRHRRSRPSSSHEGLFLTLQPGRKWFAKGKVRKAGSSVSAMISFGSETEEQPTTWRGKIMDFVTSSWFDYLSGIAVTLNAVMMGVQTDYQARNVTMVEPTVFYVWEVIFCIVFTSELLLRIIAYGREFCGQANWKWHAFDTLLVVFQISDLTWMALNDAVDTEIENTARNLSVLRMTRMFRLIRIVRLIRVIRLIHELRMLLVSIIGSLKALFWAVFLLGVLLFIMSVYLTQIVVIYRVEQEEMTSDHDRDLVHYYGSFGDTVLSLYCAVTGGVDWAVILQPVKEKISTWIVPFFCLYVSFVLLCMMNVITGAFVDSALAASKRDRSAFIVNAVYSAFARFDANRSGKLNRQEFEDALDSLELQQVFLALDLDKSEADSLFSLLDVDNSGHITPDSFAQGVTRLHGPAKAIELSILMREAARHNKCMASFVRRVDKSNKHLEAAVNMMLRSAGAGGHVGPGGFFGGDGGGGHGGRSNVERDSGGAATQDTLREVAGYLTEGSIGERSMDLVKSVRTVTTGPPSGPPSPPPVVSTLPSVVLSSYKWQTTPKPKRSEPRMSDLEEIPAELNLEEV